MPTTRDINVKIRGEGGTLWATVDDMPGVFAAGETLDELRESLAEAISFYLAEPGHEPPPVEINALETIEASTHAELALAG